MPEARASSVPESSSIQSDVWFLHCDEPQQSFRAAIRRGTCWDGRCEDAGLEVYGSISVLRKYRIGPGPWVGDFGNGVLERRN